MLGYVREQIGNGQGRISAREMETLCLSSVPILCSLASELSLTQDKQTANFGLVLVFLIDVFVFTANHKKKPKQTKPEKRGTDGEKGREFPANLLFLVTLSQGGSVRASALGCVLVSASSASLGQPWHLFHQALSRNCPNFPDRHARCCQISS